MHWSTTPFILYLRGSQYNDGKGKNAGYGSVDQPAYV
jgi:hypothetical protein